MFIQHQLKMEHIVFLIQYTWRDKATEGRPALWMLQQVQWNKIKQDSLQELKEDG